MKTKKEKNTRSNRIIYELIGKKPESLILQSADAERKPLVWRDEESGRYRPLRYITNHNSPFVDEQIEALGTGGPFYRKPIIFEGGFLVVDSFNIGLINFLDKHPHNGVKYRLRDPEAEAKRELEIMDLEDKANDLARDSSLDVLIGVVRQLTEHNVDTMDEFQIKRAARLLAREDPESFLAVASSPDFERKNIVRMAFDAKLMHFRSNNTQIWHSFPGNKTQLMTIPMGVDPYEHFERHLISSEGLELFDTLKKLLGVM
jgi:hypothetical protein